MSRWFWALLAGVVLVAIAAVVWIDQTSVLPPVLPGPTAIAPTPAPAVEKAAPSASSSPPPPAAQEAATPSAPTEAPAPAPTAPPALSAAPDAAQQAASPSRSDRVAARRSPRLLRSSRRQPSPPPAPAAEAPLPPPAPGREAQEVAGIYAPKSLAQLVGTWAYSAADCERLFQRRGSGWAYRQPVDKFAQAAIVESTKKILLPSAICRIEGASSVEGMLKVSADCEDSISYTSRSVMIALRSATELIYSASGDPVLTTTLKKCAP